MTPRDRPADDDALASKDAEHDVGVDDYLDYDPEPYERELIAAWRKAGVRPWEPSAEELENACREARELVERFNHLASR